MDSQNAEKIALFRSLFVGREDVFARRYENAKKGTSGYSPCCRNQWGVGCVLKQRKKCSECAVRQYVPVSDEAVRWHLRGKDADMKPFVMGLYPMAADETVRLSVDGVDEALADLFVHATLQFELGEHVVGGSEAPAAVLKFLYERLETCAETKGRFQMGVRLPVPCGANPYPEVGLLDPQGKIVVMLDPSSSLADIEFYRGTRREDVLLQKNGYRVLRLLVEDVCTDLDAALDDIQG